MGFDPVHKEVLGLSNILYATTFARHAIHTKKTMQITLTSYVYNVTKLQGGPMIKHITAYEKPHTIKVNTTDTIYR